MNKTLIAAAGALVVLAAGGATAFVLLNRSPDTLTVSGKVELIDQHLDTFSDSSCAGAGGFSDVRRGGQVVITSANGAVVGVGQLSDGTWSTGTKLCTFTFSVDVPAGQGFYGVEVTHRGSVKYPEAELAQPLRLSIK